MKLQAYAFQPEYRSGSSDLIADFYHPALSRSVEYWRAVGFFSSSALEAIGSPLGDFLLSNGRMRLITSVRLEADDVVALENGMRSEQVCEDRLLAQLRFDFSAPLGRGASMLASMLALGRLDVKIALPETGYGIYHEKVGVFSDSENDYISFSGSSNESRSALEVNYECVDVFPSWQDPERASAKRQHFDHLWNGTAKGVTTLNFPDAVKRELIQKANSEGQALKDVPDMRFKTSKWRHQDEAVRLFLQHRKGILEMATGTGKTHTALRICEQLVIQQQIATIVVAADGNDLLDQWHTQLVKKAVDLPSQFTVLRQYEEHKQRDRFVLAPTKKILLCSRQSLAPALKRLSPSQAAQTLLIHDEVHRLGSPSNVATLEGLSDGIPYRLGLSATPDREYDQDGNAFIERHIGPVLMQFGLEEAISRKILTPFNYFPLEYLSDSNDAERIQQVYKKVSARKSCGEPMRREEIWTELARVYKTSKAKLPIFAAFIQNHSALLQRCIIFVEEKAYGDLVLPTVHQYRHDFHTYYAEDDKETLRRFARGDIECLLTCHRLSEGIDIRSIETVILFSSARARLETIQRIGRCLRFDPNNPAKRANVVDFVRVDLQKGDADDASADQQRRQWLDRLSGIEPG